MKLMTKHRNNSPVSRSPTRYPSTTAPAPIEHTVNHHISLLSRDIISLKMEHYGIRGIALGWKKIHVTYTCGVPQGSVLWSLLFKLYTNVTPNSMMHSKTVLFVNDTSSSSSLFIQIYIYNVHRIFINVNNINMSKYCAILL